jgi:ATP-binding cassette subfamily C protein LapB
MKELLARLMARPLVAVELLIASLIANLLALASPIFVMQVINRYVSYGVDATLATLTGGMVLALAFDFAFRQVRFRLAGAVNGPYNKAFARGIFQVLAGARTQGIERLPPGLRREVAAGADTVEATYGPTTVVTLLDAPFALLYLGVLFLLSPLLALVAGGFMAAAVLLATLTLATLRRPAKELVLVSGRRNGLIATVAAAGDTLRGFNLGPHLKELWDKETANFLALRRLIARREGLVQTLTMTAQGLLGVLIIATGAVLVVRGDMTVGALIGANLLAAKALGPLIALARLGESFAKARQAADMAIEFGKLPLERTDGTTLKEYRGHLEFRDLAYVAPGAKAPLFESLSLRLEPGNLLMVTGGNGTGKTTLARLLMGILEPARGQILADGVDLAQVQPEWWRRQVAYLPQEPRFLNGPLRDNLLAVNPDLDAAGLSQLIERAGLRDFIDRSPNGLMTEISGNGDNLALGIRRRLALARALAHDGMLVVIDEPAEGLDRDGVQKVNQALVDAARRGRTILVLSHDPSTVRGATWIVDLNAKPQPRVNAGGTGETS